MPGSDPTQQPSAEDAENTEIAETAEDAEQPQDAKNVSEQQGWASPEPVHSAPVAPLAAPEPGWAATAFHQAPAYHQGQAGPAPVETADPAVARHKRKRLLWTVAAVVAAAALVTGGVIALLPGRTGNSNVAAAQCKPSDLSSCLIGAPAGAVRLTAGSVKDTWPQQTTSTAALFASNITDDSPGMDDGTEDELHDDGMGSVVHNDWNAVDGDDIDIVLLSFSSQKGAQAWNDTRAGEVLSAYSGPVVQIPGDSTGAAHAAVKPDAHGDIDAAYSAVVGNIVLNVTYSSPKTLAAQDLETWAGTELASLRKAPAAPADPTAPTARTQQVACVAGVTSCLVPMPAGGESWTQSEDKHWKSGATLTTGDLVHYLWSGDSSTVQSDVVDDFNEYGVTGVGHEDWTLDDFNEQADVYLVQAITNTGAATVDADYLANWDFGDYIAYTVPGESNAQAWYTKKKDEQGFTDVYVAATVGNTDIAAYFWFKGSFNARLTDSWAKSLISRIQGTEKTVPMGLPSLKAPALPFPTQSGCGGSADCLMPLPSGTTDTTASSYEASASLSAADYADQYAGISGQQFSKWLGPDGFQSAGHRSWKASNGATADVAVVKYANPTQAKSAATLEYGLDFAGDRVCTDSALPDSWCLAMPVPTADYLQNEQVRVVAWKGDYEVSVSVTQSNAADLAQAYAWAQQQLDMLPAS